VTFVRPTAERCFEDYVPGETHELGSVTVDEAEVVAFARRYDPQTFHVDKAAAEHSAFGGLIASGWHTASMVMRLMVDSFLPGDAGLGSPGVDEVRWLRPVRPGDTLRVRATVLSARRSASKPDRGIVVAEFSARNQHGETAMTFKGMTLMKVRNREDIP